MYLQLGSPTEEKTFLIFSYGYEVTVSIPLARTMLQAISEEPKCPKH